MPAGSPASGRLLRRPYRAKDTQLTHKEWAGGAIRRPFLLGGDPGPATGFKRKAAGPELVQCTRGVRLGCEDGLTARPLRRVEGNWLAHDQRIQAYGRLQSRPERLAFPRWFRTCS